MSNIKNELSTATSMPSAQYQADEIRIQSPECWLLLSNKYKLYNNTFIIISNVHYPDPFPVFSLNQLRLPTTITSMIRNYLFFVPFFAMIKYTTIFFIKVIISR